MNYKRRLRIKQILYFWILPFYVLGYLFSNKKDLLDADLLRFHRTEKASCFRLIKMLIETLLMTKTFRNIYYLRCGYFAYPFSKILKPVSNVELTKQVGGGILLIHGFSVVINPHVKIGRNCTIHQNVTIGDVKGGVPTLGDNVSIGAGAIIIGDIHIGNNVKIGAGAIVVEDVPDGVTIICQKAQIIQK